MLAARGLPHRALVVENDDETRRQLAIALAEADRTVVCLNKSEDALNHIHKDTPFDLMISGIRMPGFDGRAVLREAMSRNRQTRVVLLSAVAELEEYQELMDSGAFDYLPKPLNIRDLEETVRRALAC